MKNKFRTLAASVATAGLLAGGALAVSTASASAAVTSPVTSQVRHAPADQLSLTFEGNTYKYAVNLREQWVAPGTDLVTGTLTDTYEPHAITLQVHGVQFGNDAVLSVAYPSTGPDAGSQGVRTFSGTVGFGGQVAGSWSETGTEGGSGAFSITRI